MAEAKGWLAAKPPGAGAGQLGPAEQLGQLRAAEEAAGALVRVAARDRRIDAVRSAGKKVRIRDSSV